MSFGELSGPHWLEARRRERLRQAAIYRMTVQDIDADPIARRRASFIATRLMCAIEDPAGPEVEAVDLQAAAEWERDRLEPVMRELHEEWRQKWEAFRLGRAKFPPPPMRLCPENREAWDRLFGTDPEQVEPPRPDPPAPRKMRRSTSPIWGKYLVGVLTAAYFAGLGVWMAKKWGVWPW